MVGYRNGYRERLQSAVDFIRHSDGGVSELELAAHAVALQTLSGIPMVGYRNPSLSYPS